MSKRLGRNSTCSLLINIYLSLEIERAEEKFGRKQAGSQIVTAPTSCRWSKFVPAAKRPPSRPPDHISTGSRLSLSESQLEDLPPRLAKCRPRWLACLFLQRLNMSSRFDQIAARLQIGRPRSVKLSLPVVHLFGAPARWRTKPKEMLSECGFCYIGASDPLRALCNRLPIDFSANSWAHNGPGASLGCKPAVAVSTNPSTKAVLTQ